MVCITKTYTFNEIVCTRGWVVPFFALFFFGDKHSSMYGNMRQWIENPYAKGNRIYLLFDSVHIFKNFYNNFLNRKCFIYPPFYDDEEGEKVANFCHLEDLHKVIASIVWLAARALSLLSCSIFFILAYKI